MAVRRNALPGVRLNPLPDIGHRLLEQLLVIGLVQVADQVDPRLHRVEQINDGQIGCTPDTADLIADEVAPATRRQGAQPTPEAPRRVIREVGQVPDQLEQDHLRDVLGIGILEPPPQAPGVDLWAVSVDERRPGRLIGRVVAQGHQYTNVRTTAGRRDHEPTPASRSWAPPVCANRIVPRVAALPESASETARVGQALSDATPITDGLDSGNATGRPGVGTFRCEGRP